MYFARSLGLYKGLGTPRKANNVITKCRSKCCHLWKVRSRLRARRSFVYCARSKRNQFGGRDDELASGRGLCRKRGVGHRGWGRERREVVSLAREFDTDMEYRGDLQCTNRKKQKNLKQLQIIFEVRLSTHCVYYFINIKFSTPC